LKKVFLRSIVFWLLCLSLLSLLSSCSTEKKRADSGKAPDFTLKNLEGEEIALSKLKGRVVLLDFWATWCGPCRESIPHLIDLYNNFQSKGFTIIGMSVDKEKEEETLRRFVKSMDIPYPVVLSPEQLARQYGISGIPTTLLIDREGKILEKIVGFNSTIAKHLTSKISELTGEKP
jgi:peroxiredoxin